MVPFLQKPVEIPHVLFLDKVVVMLVCCTTRGAHGLNCAENRSGSAVAVHRQIRRHLCRCCATTDAHGPDFAETRGDSTGWQLQFIDKFVSIPVVSKRLILIVRLSTRRHQRKLWRVFEIGELLPGHPIFVTAPVLEVPPAVVEYGVTRSVLWSAWSPHPWSRTHMLLPLSRLQ